MHVSEQARVYFAMFAAPVPLQSVDGGRSGLLLDLLYQFNVESASGWGEQSSERMYAYRLLDHHETELLVYHWQPGADYLGPDEHHLHVSAAVRAQVNAVSRREIDLDNLHLVTGPVTLAGIVRMLIEEFGIAPQRADWNDILHQEEYLGDL
jgi:hypothetical protein